MLLLGLLVFSLLSGPPALALSRPGDNARAPFPPGSFRALSAIRVIQKVQDEREDLSRVVVELELHYGRVRSRSLEQELSRITRSITPFLPHPEFPVQVILIDNKIPACFFLGGETVVLTRGLVFSGLLKNTDAVAGLVALLLSRHNLMAEGDPSPSASALEHLIRTRNRAAEKAAVLLIRAGYHYAGILEAVRVLDSLRSGADWSRTLAVLIRDKGRILTDASEIEDGISLLLAGRPAAAVPFLRRYVAVEPRSTEGRFWLGLAYYRDAARTFVPHRETLLFSVDPVPGERRGEARGEGEVDRDLAMARRQWAGILRENPTFSPAWNGLARLAMMQGRLESAVLFFGRAASLNPESPWYAADFGQALWMRDHKVLGLRKWEDAAGLAGFDPRLVYDREVLAQFGGTGVPTAFAALRNLPGWEFVATLWGEETGTRQTRPLPAFVGQFLPAPLMPGLSLGQVRHLVGLPETAPIRSHRYLIWAYRTRNYRLVFRSGRLRIAEFYGKNRKVLPSFPDRGLPGRNAGARPDDPAQVVPYARVSFLQYRTRRHIWLLQRVGTVLDRCIVLPDIPDRPGGMIEAPSTGSLVGARPPKKAPGGTH